MIRYTIYDGKIYDDVYDVYDDDLYDVYDDDDLYDVYDVYMCGYCAKTTTTRNTLCYTYVLSLYLLENKLGYFRLTKELENNSYVYR